MLKKILIAVGFLLLGLVAAGAIAYATNSAPVVPALSIADPAIGVRPYVVKVHAKWCPGCMMTKGTWTKLEEKYRGRVNFVVLDVTNDATTAASEAEVKRVGLDKFYTDHGYYTGTIGVLDAGTKAERGFFDMHAKYEEYIAAIDAALGEAAKLKR